MKEDLKYMIDRLFEMDIPDERLVKNIQLLLESATVYRLTHICSR